MMQRMKKFLFILITVLGSSYSLQAQTEQLMEKTFEKATKRDAQIEKYLKDNKIYDVQVSPEGIYYVKENHTDGAAINAGEYVSVHYTGKLLNGKKFDSSLDRGEPITFKIGVGYVIPGWDKGIPLFKVGEKGTLFIPSDLAYGSQGAGGIIPANAPLIFNIQIIQTEDEATYQQEQKKRMLKLQAEAEARSEAQAKIDQKVIEDYIHTKQLKNVKFLPSGLAYYMEKEGDGKQVTKGSTAVVHYTGMLLDGTKFDSSKDRNQPFAVQVGANRVIQGWEQGLPLFKAGGKGVLIIPSRLGYGERGAGGIIKPNSVLIFEIEVLEVK